MDIIATDTPIRFIYCTKEELSKHQVRNGFVYYVTDTGEILFDIDNERKSNISMVEKTIQSALAAFAVQMGISTSTDPETGETTLNNTIDDNFVAENEVSEISDADIAKLFETKQE